MDDHFEEGGEAWAAAAEQRLLDQALRLAPTEGWTSRMAKLAGRAAGFSEGETELLLPRGPADLAVLLSRRQDERMMILLSDVDPQSLKIRERIARGLEARLDAAAADEAAMRRVAGYFALPPNVALGGKLAWQSADAIWRWAGDVSTDENHYSKRALVAGILTGAMAIRLSSSRAAALRFVQRRIDDVMRFEKWKATSGFQPTQILSGLAGRLSRMRYGRSESAE